ncbi:MAG: hypothetical protein KAI70_00675 [Candidatus Omnitrophica bacterium]|nr:hypothetical protein [Candidatus Omnitrophota bacterium]
MPLYVNTVELEFNGAKFTDFESFTDTSVTKFKQVNLMGKTGHAKMTPRYSFTCNVKSAYVKPPVDLSSVEGGTCTVIDDAKNRTSYYGVYTLETGDGTIDGETELTKTVTFGAENKIEE